MLGEKKFGLLIDKQMNEANCNERSTCCPRSPDEPDSAQGFNIEFDDWCVGRLGSMAANWLVCSPIL
jgi:hypothetical protein